MSDLILHIWLLGTLFTYGVFLGYNHEGFGGLNTLFILTVSLVFASAWFIFWPVAAIWWLAKRFNR